jgi:hypothetical protein
MIEVIFFCVLAAYTLWMVITAYQNGFGNGFMQSMLIAVAIVGAVFLVVGLNWISAAIIIAILIFKPNFILPDFGKPPSLK